MKILVIIPAYNEASVIYQTIRSLCAEIQSLHADVLVVDDGSTDGTGSEALRAGVNLVTHVLNRGLGGAIGTGLMYARKHHYDIAVTFDADGQHEPTDIKKVIAPIKNDKADVVIGTRYHNSNKNMPWDRQLILRASNFFTYLLFGQQTTDSLSGFRAFNGQAIQQIQIKTDRMEVSNELLSEIKRLQLRLTEVPITVIYTEYSRAKGQSNSNAINIIIKLLLRLFR